MLIFLLDCLRFNKLLKLHQTEDRISSNLLKQSSRKTSMPLILLDAVIPTLVILVRSETHRKKSVATNVTTTVLIGCVQQKKQVSKRFALIGLYI